MEPLTPIDDSRESWNELEHVALGMPTTWNIVTSTLDFQDRNLEEDLGMYMGLDLYAQV